MKKKHNVKGYSAGCIGIKNGTVWKRSFQIPDQNDDYPIQLRIKEANRNKLEELNIKCVPMDMSTQRFKQIPISSIAKQFLWKFNFTINRKNQKRVQRLVQM